MIVPTFVSSSKLLLPLLEDGVRLFSRCSSWRENKKHVVRITKHVIKIRKHVAKIVRHVVKVEKREVKVVKQEVK